MRWYIIAALLGMSAQPVSDWLAERRFHEEQGYDKSEVEKLNRMSAETGAAFQLKPSPSRMVYVWRTKEAAMLADAYSLRPQDLDSTVDVRRMK